jgi:hypothetical protein
MSFAPGGSMNPNPYQPPTSIDGSAEASGRQNRTLFVLAAIGAGLAALYWAGLILMMGLGSVSGAQFFLPCVLVGFYGWRGYQIFRGDASAAKRILWLHGVGLVMALLQMASGNPLLLLLYGVKIAIHLFGGVTAFLAQRPRYDG